MATVTAYRRTTSSPVRDAALPLRRLSVDEHHALHDLGVLPDGGVELLEGLLVERRPVPRKSDPWVDGQQVPVRRLTLEDYQRIRDAGTLDAGKPCEFIDGLLVETASKITQHPLTAVPADLIEAIQSFPHRREAEHCGQKFAAGALDMYADCPTCGTRLKLRSFGAATQLEDVFDAVLEWMADPDARQSAEARLRAIDDDN